VTRRLFRRIKS